MNQLNQTENKIIHNHKIYIKNYLKTKMMIQINQINHASVIVHQNANVLKILFQKRELKSNCKNKF